ncbi:MAG: SBBP repeat-containing protein [Ignavibacteria bacterium]|nr:SBBP repeat-containing protein [Ignavibacteria bacterium]
MESLNNRTYIMPEADIKPFFPADSVVASDRILHTLTGLGNNKAVATFIAVICFLMTANLNAQTLDWVKTFGGIGDDFCESMVIDAVGNVYTVGGFQNTVDFDPGIDSMMLSALGWRNIFIQKLDKNGNFLWAKSIGGKGNDFGGGIALDAASNVYITGGFDDTVDFDPGMGVTKLTAVGKKDIFIQKLDANGNFLWAKSFGGRDYDRGTSIAVDADGNVYTTGYFIDTVDFDPGPDSMKISAVGLWDSFIQKLDANGNLLWAKSIGGNNESYSFLLAIDAKGNVYTSGNFTDSIKFDPGTGVKNLSAKGDEDVFILKYNDKGNLLWAKSFGGKSNDYSQSIAFDDKGNVYTIGSFSEAVDFNLGNDTVRISAVGASDIYIQKMDADGNFIWAKSFGGMTSDGGSSIAIDNKGNIFTTGSFRESVDFDPGIGMANLSAIGESDIFIQKLDENGNFLWAKSFGGNLSDVGSSIFIDTVGDVFTTGSLRGTVDFDPGTDVKNLTSVGGEDIFVHKMKQTATGVADMGNGIDISLYPNPSNGFIHIALNEAVGEAAITITDLQGKIIHSEQMSAATKSSMDIQAPNGVYFIHVKTAKGQSIMKLIKE